MNKSIKTHLYSANFFSTHVVDMEMYKEDLKK